MIQSLILEKMIDVIKCLLVYVYNTNTKQEQLKTLQNLSVMLQSFDSFCSNNEIITGDFKLFSSKTLECKVGDLYLIPVPIPHKIKILETFDLCDI